MRRAQPVAISGYSGLDGFTTFPFGAPHVHFNVWLDGEYVDPFAITGETALWCNGNWPTPCADPDPEEHKLVDDPMLAELWKAYKRCICAQRTGPAAQLLQNIEDHL